MTAKADTVVSAILHACSGRQMTTLRCGNLQLNMEHLTEKDMKDSGCRELLMRSVTICHESHILCEVEKNLTAKQKSTTFAGYFENSPDITRETYEKILGLLALAVSNDSEVDVNQDSLTMWFKDDDAKTLCQERARNTTLTELVACLKLARLNETRDLNELRSNLMQCQGEWAAKIRMADILLSKGKGDQALIPLQKINIEKVNALFAQNLRQKAWMDLYPSLSVHMTGFAFNANISDARGEGFDKARSDFDEALDKVLQKQMEIDNYTRQMTRERTRLKEFQAARDEEKQDIDEMRSKLAKRMQDLDAECAHLQRKIEETRNEGHKVSLFFWSWDKSVDRSPERESLTKLMELRGQQREETERTLADLTSEKVNEEAIKQCAEIQKIIDLAQGEKEKAEKELERLVGNRDEKLTVLQNVTDATAKMLASTGACTQEQALASLEAASMLEATMGNASIESCAATRLYTTIQCSLELLSWCQSDTAFLDDLKEELNTVAQTPLVKMLNDTIGVTTLPIEYESQLRALADAGPSVTTMTGDEESGRA